MASVTLAVVTSSVDGKVEWTFKNSDQFGGSVDGKIIFDLAKDFGEGYSAGLKVKLDPTNDNNSDELKYDGDGWIKMVKDFGTLTFQTGGLGGNAASELGVGYDMASAAGVKLESTSLVEGLNLTVVVNDTFKKGKLATDDGNYANYLLKGEYKTDTMTIGAGYQAHTLATGITIPTEKDAMAVWAGYKLGDALNLGLEYASRPNLDGNDGAVKVEGSTGIRVKADYTAGALTVNAKVQVQSGAFYNIDPDDVGSISAFNFFQYGYDRDMSQSATTLIYTVNHADPEDGSGIAGTAVKVDVAYKVTDAITLSANVEDILEGAETGCDTYTTSNYGYTLNTTPGGTAVDAKKLMSYKVGVSDALSEKLTLSAYYAGYGDLSEIQAKAEYTFVAGLVGSLELKSDSTVGVAKSTDTYTATLKATL